MNLQNQDRYNQVKKDQSLELSDDATFGPASAPRLVRSTVLLSFLESMRGYSGTTPIGYGMDSICRLQPICKPASQNVSAALLTVTHKKCSSHGNHV